MTNTKPLFILLTLLAMACTLTAQSAAINATSLPEPSKDDLRQTTTASPTLSPAPKICQVKTGVDAGALNLRACGGIHCPIASVLHEGETLTQTEAQAVNDWLEVQTANGLTGWVNSKYLDCEVTK